MDSADQWIDKFLKRVRIGEFLKHAADFSAVFLFTFGTIVLLVKLLMPALWPHVLWLALGALPTMIAARWYVRRDWCRRDESVAMLDNALQAGGLLMTLHERPDTNWKQQLPQLELQYQQALPKYRPRRFASFVVLPLIFAVASCFVPLRAASSASSADNHVAHRATEELEELLAALNEAPVLEEQEQEQLEQELQRLADETEKTPLTSENWETLDALRERMQIRLDSTEMNLTKALEAAGQLKQSGADGEQLTVEQKLRLEKNLTSALKKLQNKGQFKNAPAELQKNLLELMKDGQLQLPQDAAQRQQQLENLQKHLDDELRKLDKIREQHNCGQCRGEGQRDGRSESGRNGRGEQGQRQGGNSSQSQNNSRPGSGGINRGRGDAQMSWGDESDEQGIKFKERLLPEGLQEQPKDEVKGIKASAPDVDPATAATRGLAREGGPAAGETTTRRRLSPKHRAAVRKFFGKADP